MYMYYYRPFPGVRQRNSCNSLAVTTVAYTTLYQLWHANFCM